MRYNYRTILAGLSAVSLLCGCGSSAADSPASSQTQSSAEESSAEFEPRLDPQISGKIRVAGNYSNFETLETEFGVFQDYYPNVELSYDFLDDYNHTIDTALEGEDAPDIYVAPQWMLDKEEHAGVFEHAEDLSDPELGINLDVIRAGILYRDETGRVPMVPVFSSTYGMMVNEDLFEKEGLSVPTTLDQLLEVSAALKEKGYEHPMLGYNTSGSNSMFYNLAYPMFCGELKQQPQSVIDSLNHLETEAGESMRSALEFVKILSDKELYDLKECRNLEDGYEALILRFFEGDIPMAIVTGDTVSGTLKRESLSEAYTASPFRYRFYLVPCGQDGGYFLNVPSLEFAVNKNSDVLDITNEFMRFLISTKELNQMAATKRLVTPTSDMTFDEVFSALNTVPAEMTVFSSDLNLLDNPAVEFRKAAYFVGNGEMSVDEAVAAFGTLKDR